MQTTQFNWQGALAGRMEKGHLFCSGEVPHKSNSSILMSRSAIPGGFVTSRFFPNAESWGRVLLHHIGFVVEDVEDVIPSLIKRGS